MAGQIAKLQGSVDCCIAAPIQGFAPWPH
jgi:hypothetical protein